MAATAAARGDRAGADWEAQEIRSLDPGFTVAGWLESYPLASRPHRERLSRALVEAGLRP
jgi:hypothetical protein